MHRRKLAKSLLVLLCVCAFSFVPVGVYAEPAKAAVQEELDLSMPTPTFVEVIDAFFSDKYEAKVLASTGEDISDQFYVSHLTQYLSGEYSAMWNCFVANDLIFSWVEEPDASARTILHPTATQSFYQLATTNNGKKTFETKINLTGNYSVNDSVGEIIGATSPSLDVEFLGLGALFNAQLTGVSTWKSIAANKKSVQFGATFSVAVTAFTPEYGFTIWDSTAGPYSKSFTAYA